MKSKWKFFNLIKRSREEFAEVLLISIIEINHFHSMNSTRWNLILGKFFETQIFSAVSNLFFSSFELNRKSWKVFDDLINMNDCHLSLSIMLIGLFLKLLASTRRDDLDGRQWYELNPNQREFLFVLSEVSMTSSIWRTIRMLTYSMLISTLIYYS